MDEVFDADAEQQDDTDWAELMQGPVIPNYDFEWGEIPIWAREMAGPWARRRSHVSTHLDKNKWPFVDLANPEKDGPKVEWLIDGFLPTRYLAVLGGDSKSGKSWFVTALALAIATGTPFMGMPTQKRAVIWLSFEENEMERQLAFDAYFAAGGTRPDNLKFLTCYERLFIDDAEALRQIGETAWGTEAGLIVVDPLHAAYSAGSIADGATARRVLSGIKGLCRMFNLSVLVLHHLTKRVGTMTRERIAESGQILAAASMDWLMEVEIEGPRGVEGSKVEGRGSEEGECSRKEAEAQFGRPLTPPPTPSPSSLRSDKEGAPELPTSGSQGGRTIRLVGRGRGADVNRSWMIESPAPMVYRLADRVGFGSSLEQRILDVLAEWRDQERGTSCPESSGNHLTSREIAALTGAGVGAIRNVITRLVSAKRIRVASQDGRTRWYELG